MRLEEPPHSGAVAVELDAGQLETFHQVERDLLHYLDVGSLYVQVQEIEVEVTPEEESRVEYGFPCVDENYVRFILHTLCRPEVAMRRVQCRDEVATGIVEGLRTICQSDSLIEMTELWRILFELCEQAP